MIMQLYVSSIFIIQTHLYNIYNFVLCVYLTKRLFLPKNIYISLLKFKMRFQKEYSYEIYKNARCRQ